MPTQYDNIPNGKSSQAYYCMESWEAKHIAGVKYTKCDEFRAFPGITSIKSIDVIYNQTDKIYHKFRIESVDNIILKMTELVRSVSAKQSLGMFIVDNLGKICQQLVARPFNNKTVNL
jgi:hypothetical protein